MFDLQIDPSGNGLQLHRIGKCKDDNFWSARVNRDVRLIVHKTASSKLVAYRDSRNRYGRKKTARGSLPGP